MTISFSCPSCGAARRAATALIGRHVRCPECDAIVEVPEFSDVPENGNSSAPQEEAEELIALELVPSNSPSAPQEWRPIATPGLTPLPPAVPRYPAATPYPTGLEPIDRPTPPPPPAPASKEVEAEEQAPAPTKRMNRDDTEMDMTPMVDVVFQLLIFFMLTAAFALQKSKEVPKPNPESPTPSTQVIVDTPKEDNPDFVTVKIDSQNTYRVITVDWDEEAPNEHELFVKMRAAKQGDKAGHVPTKLIVQIHEEALQDKLIAALDAGTAIEISEVEIMTVSQDE